MQTGTRCAERHFKQVLAAAVAQRTGTKTAADAVVPAYMPMEYRGYTLPFRAD